MNAPARRAFVCCGQGAQLDGLGKVLFAHAPHLAAKADALSSAAGRNLGRLLQQTIDPADTLAVHVALTAYALLAFETVPDTVLCAGHSLGEIAALTCAGALSPEDALRLAAVRGQALAEACADGRGGMLAVMHPASPPHEYSLEDHVMSLIKLAKERKTQVGQAAHMQDIWLANSNSPAQVVLSGHKAALASCAPHLENAGLRVLFLPVAGAFHTPYMAIAAERVFDFAQHLEWRPLNRVCLSSVTGRVLTEGSFAAHCALQIIEPVRWLSVMLAMQRAEITEITEACPDGILCRLGRAVPGWAPRTAFCPPWVYNT